MQIYCQFASDFVEKRLHYCTTIALQKSCDKPANRRAASDEKPTPEIIRKFESVYKLPLLEYFCPESCYIKMFLLLRPDIFPKRLGVTGLESSGQNSLQKVSTFYFYILFHCFVIH